MPNGSSGDVLVRDLGAREKYWDTSSHAKGRALTKRIEGTMLKIMPYQTPAFNARGRRVSTNPDLATTNLEEGTVEVKEVGM